jgi:hypothetical protein
VVAGHGTRIRFSKKEFGNAINCFASLLVLAGTAAQAEIVCTTHRGCFETGGRIILGNGGGVNRQESTISHRDAKPKKIVFRRHYNTGE